MHKTTLESAHRAAAAAKLAGNLSCKSGEMWWLLTLVAACAAFLCGIWVARCRYLPHIASLERSTMEAMSIRDHPEHRQSKSQSKSLIRPLHRNSRVKSPEMRCTIAGFQLYAPERPRPRLRFRGPVEPKVRLDHVPAHDFVRVALQTPTEKRSKQSQRSG